MSLRINLIPALLLILCTGLGAQGSLHLQSGFFEGKLVSGPEDLIQGPVFILQDSHAKLPDGFRLIGLYGNGWKLVYISENADFKSVLSGGIKRFYYPKPADKISPANSNNETWWIHVAGPPDAELTQLKSVGLSNVFEFKGTKADAIKFAQFPSVYWVEPGPGEPTPDNEESGAWLGNPSGLVGLAAFRTRGAGVTVQVNDDGMIGPHIDFKGRVNQAGATLSPVTEDHGDHIAGTIAGAGNRWPESEGISPEALLRVLDYSTDPNSAQGFFAIPQTFFQDGVRVVNTSYSDGCNSGYTALSRFLDEQTQLYPTLVHVFSAGNAGTANCGYGAGAGWGNITGGHKMAKNVLTIGNLSSPGQISTTSSRGPAYDGRIKPDLVAPGSGVLSTSSLLGANSYLIRSGTSMSAPMIAGIFSNLIAYYRGQNQQTDPPAALLKAILLNTARDVGAPGPDYLSGYGLPNVQRALTSIRNSMHTYVLLDQGNTWDTIIQVPNGLREVKFLIHWDDLPAGVGAGTALIQDLDIEVRPPGGNWTKPWILNSTPNPQALSELAVRGSDHLNTTEQVSFSTPVSGAYEIRVSATSMQNSFQWFAFTWSFLPPGLELGYPKGGDKLIAGDSIQVWWEAETGILPFSIDLSLDAGSSWIPLASNIPSNRREYKVLLPQNAFSRQALMRINRGSQFSFSDSLFWIGPVPENLKVDSICGAEVFLSWNSLSGASNYRLFQLGNRFMEPVAQTANTELMLFPVNTSVINWFSVSASYSDMFTGRRSRAVETAPGNFNCITQRDLEISEVSFPVAGSLPQCVFASTPPPSFWVKNKGTIPVNQFNAGFSLNGGTAQQQLVAVTILPGDSALVTLSQGINPSIGSHEMRYWINFPGDQQPYNDSLTFTFSVLPSIVESTPHLQNFDNFFLCNTIQGCENIWCSLQSGWRNASNSIEDNIDWRVNWGPTPTEGTGPTNGATSTAGLNRYLYTQAAGCSASLSELYSPCFQLPGSVSYLYFHYHMKGADMGKLHVEMLENGFWHSLWQLSGNQGEAWNTAKISLSGFENRTVLFRISARTGTGSLGDIAIDGFNIDTINVNIQPANGLSFCKGDSLNLVATGNSTLLSSGIWQLRYNENSLNLNGTSNPVIVLNETGLISGNFSVQSGGYPFFFQYHVIDKPTAQFSYFEVGNGSLEFTDISMYSGNAEWYFGDGNSATGTSVQHTYTQNGNWLVTLVSQNSCGIDTVQDIISVSTVGVDFWQSEQDVRVFPNPFTSGFVINGLPSNQSSYIELHDIQGRLILSAETSEKTWNSGAIIGESGVYLLTIQSEDSTKRLRLIRIKP